MSKPNHHHSRSLSLKIPTVTFSGPRQPTLQEILANVAPAPWTLSAFMAYLSQNHCLETLEFTMEAAKYEQKYHARLEPMSLGSQSHDDEYVHRLWLKLLDAYIRPNGPREVNLPSDIRDHLVSLTCSATSPPHPSELVKAVKITYELMDQSVLVPFINAVKPSRSIHDISCPCISHESIPSSAVSSERCPSPPKSRRNSNGHLYVDNNSSSFLAYSPRPSHSLRSGCRISSFIFGNSPSSSTISTASTSNCETNDSSTDDDISSICELVTPPSTPPSASSGWKKMSAKFYYRRKPRSSASSATGTHLSPLLHETSCDAS